jgi:hypothetical protein
MLDTYRINHHYNLAQYVNASLRPLLLLRVLGQTDIVQRILTVVETVFPDNVKFLAHYYSPLSPFS